MTAAYKLEFVQMCLENGIFTPAESRALLQHTDEWGEGLYESTARFVNDIQNVLDKHQIERETVNNELP